MQTIIFDLDGTLADSAVITLEAFRQAAALFELPQPAAESIRAAIGYANPEFYHRIYPNEPKKLVEKAGLYIEQRELEILDTLQSDLLFPGCRELLLQLKALGITLYIASTGSRDHVFSILDKTGISGFFADIHCGQPDKTDMIKKIINTSNKRDFLMVGDMEKDSIAAFKNGILSAGACYGYCPRGERGFNYYLDAPLDLIALFNTKH